MRNRSLVAVAVAVVVVAAGVLVAFHATMGKPSRAHALPVIADVGGDFELSRAGGARVYLHDYRGRIVLLAFGYTYCPDVCPTTLSTLKVAMDDLGKAADRVQVVMVTVDPERDTAEHLEQYVRYFHPQFVGLSGTTQEIAQVARQYRVHYQKGQSLPGGGYQVSHSAHIYLLDTEGRLRTLLSAGARHAEIADGVRQLLQEATIAN